MTQISLPGDWLFFHSTVGEFASQGGGGPGSAGHCSGLPGCRTVFRRYFEPIASRSPRL